MVAATLLDLKAARLLPAGEIEDAEDLALLEARDLLFARLLQYRAYKHVADFLGADAGRAGAPLPARRRTGAALRLAAARRRPRPTPERFAALAAKALTPAAADVISLAHLHAPEISVRDQAALLVDRLRRDPTHRRSGHLTADAPDRVTTVARFLALLELFREGAVAFEQLTPLGELTVRWTGSDSRGARDHRRVRRRRRNGSAGRQW